MDREELGIAAAVQCPEPFGQCRLAAHDPGHMAGIEEQRMRVDVG